MIVCFVSYLRKQVSRPTRPTAQDGASLLALNANHPSSCPQCKKAIFFRHLSSPIELPPMRHDFGSLVADSSCPRRQAKIVAFPPPETCLWPSHERRAVSQSGSGCSDMSPLSGKSSRTSSDIKYGIRQSNRYGVLTAFLTSPPLRSATEPWGGPILTHNSLPTL